MPDAHLQQIPARQRLKYHPGEKGPGPQLCAAAARPRVLQRLHGFCRLSAEFSGLAKLVQYLPLVAGRGYGGYAKLSADVVGPYTHCEKH